MWSRQLFLVLFFSLTILATQSHVIHKRGLLSKLFGGNSRSTQDVDADMAPQERSKVRELLKNPIVITMLSAAVGMVVQQALATKNMNGICDNKYVKMAYMAGNMHPPLQQALNLFGCNGPNRKYGDNNNNANDQYGVSATPGYNNNEEGGSDNNQNKNTNNGGTSESGFSPEKQSKLQQLMGIVRGEKGSKRNFLKGLFGLNNNDKTFEQGHELPSSSYKLDKDDADSMKNLEQEIEQNN